MIKSCTKDPLARERKRNLPLTFLTAQPVKGFRITHLPGQKLGMEIDTWDTATNNPDTR
jgi:hypothetical protein